MTTPTTTSGPSPVTNTPAPSCTTAVPGEHGYVPPDACNANYNYDPAYVPAIVVASIFAFLSLAHIIEGFLYRKRFAWVVTMGALWETVAFVFGALGARDQQNQTFATGHLLLFLLAPLWINAFVYMTLGRMIHFFLPDQKVWKIKSTQMSKIFVWADVVTFLVQLGGGSMAVPGAEANTVKWGLNIYTIGVGLQEGCIFLFLALMIIFHRKALALDSGAVLHRSDNGQDEYFVPKKGWKMTLYALYTVLALITMRIAFRMAEFAGGLDPAKNPLPFNENYAYGLDAAPMAVALVVLLVYHPGRVLQGPNADFAEARRELKLQKKARKAARNGKHMELSQRSSAGPYYYESA